MQLTLKNVRLAFPALFDAKTVNGEGKPAFSANFIIDPTDPQINTINQVIEEVATKKWASKAQTILKSLRNTAKVALHDGDAKESYEGFAGNLYISARSQARPTVVDQKRNPLTEADGKLYAGCVVNASVDFWAQDSTYGKRINASLKGVQFVKDNEAFSGGGGLCTNDFEDLTVNETMDSPF